MNPLRSCRYCPICGKKHGVTFQDAFDASFRKKELHCASCGSVLYLKKDPVLFIFLLTYWVLDGAMVFLRAYHPSLYLKASMFLWEYGRFSSTASNGEVPFQLFYAALALLIYSFFHFFTMLFHPVESERVKKISVDSDLIRDCVFFFLVLFSYFFFSDLVEEGAALYLSAALSAPLIF